MVEIIKKLCDEKGISIPKMATDCGISSGNIYRWDANKPSIDKVKRVADYLGVTVNDLLGYPSTALSPQEQQIIDLARQLNADGRLALLSTLKGIVSQPQYIKNNSDQAVEGIA